MIPRAIGIASVGTVALFVLLGIAIPLAVLLAEGSLRSSLLDPEVLAVALATVRQATLSTALSALAGLPLGLWVGSLDRRSRALAIAVLRIPYGVPTVVAGAAWVACLGRNGLLARLGLPLDLAYTFTAVVIAHVFFNAPWVAAIVAEARGSVPESLDDAARGLGAGRLGRFAHVHWPVAGPALASASAQVFALCSMSFALVLILGGGPPVDTLETALYAKLRFGSLDVSAAAAFALWELAITLAPWLAVLLLTRASVSSHSASRERRPSSRVHAWAALALSALFLAPYLAVLAPPKDFAQLAAPAWVSLRIALVAALGATFVAAVALVAGAWLGRASRPGATLVSALLALPAGISVLVLGLGLWLAYERFIDPFEGSLAAMCFLQVVIFAPLAYRALWPVARGARTRLLEAAATLGASPLRAFFAVEWPRWRGPVGGTAALVAGASLGEVAAVSLFYSERLVPLPLVISRWMAQYRFEDAQGLSTLLLLLSVGVMLLSAKVTHGRA